MTGVYTVAFITGNNKHEVWYRGAGAKVWDGQVYGAEPLDVLERQLIHMLERGDSGRVEVREDGELLVAGMATAPPRFG